VPTHDRIRARAHQKPRAGPTPSATRSTAHPRRKLPLRNPLARAFLKDAPILILDEPTSSVDINTEAGILEAMERLMEGRTTMVIAHRLNTLERCHMILQIEAGRLVSVRSTTLQESEALSGGSHAGV
jgi:ABC-type Mn2+/Zn2+ transport system ATPase subunit